MSDRRAWLGRGVSELGEEPLLTGARVTELPGLCALKCVCVCVCVCVHACTCVHVYVWGHYIKLKSKYRWSLWRRKWHPTPVLLPGKSQGWVSLVGCSPWGLEESDMTEQPHFHFSLSCIGEGNGNPLHCSCLENPRDGGAWWAAVYGVTQSRTQLKRLSSSSSSCALDRLVETRIILGT